MRIHRLVFIALIVSLILLPLYGQPGSLYAVDSFDNMLVLAKNKKEMLHNGKRVVASQPYEIIKGTAYVALNGIAQPFGFKLSYDAAAKESIAVSESMNIRLKWNSNLVTVNGTLKTWSEPTLLKRGSLMIPLRMWADLTASTVSAEGNDTIVQWRSAPVKPLAPLQVSDNGRYLVTSSGEPFFWLADTAWELIQRLTRIEADTYLTNVAEQGFNVVQVTALSHFWNLNVPNAHGDLPLEGADPDKPLATAGSNPANAAQYDYWDHADYVIDTAASLGIYVALLPTWGKYIIDNGAPPDNQPYQGIFDFNSAYNFGKWIGSRYADRSNIIWVLGGDRAPNTEPERELVRRMARGIKDGGATQLITFHPIGGKSSSEWFQNESWLDFNMYQSGHLSVDYPNYKVIASDYLKKPVKPIIDAEPRYEDSGINFSSANGRFSAYDVRQAAYWSVFAGSFGHSYGNGAIWQMHASGYKADEIQYWHDALNAAGRSQMKHLRKLMESRPFVERVPDQSLVTNALSGGSRIQATKGTNYAMVYSPRGAAFSVSMGTITGDTVTARWYNPRTGVSDLIGEFANAGTQAFQPPSGGVGNDWVLLLDDTNANFSSP
ncbi:DUF4038 domain-containing protein [Cohnella panacarvi]|uniref:apiosidase-like domain-containing protein n=1 Tax=Cohnella panacarvi TaxID=400776 RepID=UPI0004797CD7|nr:DUF4038 domain-containing protein [Cohnella panacarvi]